MAATCSAKRNSGDLHNDSANENADADADFLAPSSSLLGRQENSSLAQMICLFLRHLGGPGLLDVKDPNTSVIFNCGSMASQKKSEGSQQPFTGDSPTLEYKRVSENYSELTRTCTIIQEGLEVKLHLFHCCSCWGHRSSSFQGTLITTGFRVMWSWEIGYPQHSPTQTAKGKISSMQGPFLSQLDLFWMFLSPNHPPC